MAEGRQRDEWQRTSTLIASVATMFGGGTKYEPARFDPFAKADAEQRNRTSKTKRMKLPIEILKPLFGIKD